MKDERIFILVGRIRIIFYITCSSFFVILGYIIPFGLWECVRYTKDYFHYIKVYYIQVLFHTSHCNFGLAEGHCLLYPGLYYILDVH